jgi:hypothetical protein
VKHKAAAAFIAICSSSISELGTLLNYLFHVISVLRRGDLFFISYFSRHSKAKSFKTQNSGLFAYMLHERGELTGIAFVDSTSIAVCHGKRISRSRVFKGLAKIGKTTSGWFYELKLHLIVIPKQLQNLA